MKKIVHKADSRGHANHGWLDSYHTFSFANYYDPQRINFGALRVLNDDTIRPRTGFGKHPHDNMEIVSIPLSGSIRHEDNMGHSSVIGENEVQVMSAGRGIVHSEYNASDKNKTNFLQLWIIPDTLEVDPRYEQKEFNPELRQNALQTVIAPRKSEISDALWLNQSAYLSLSDMESGIGIEYKLFEKGHGIYCFIISGSFEVAGESLSARDGIGIWDTESVEIKTIESGSILIIEVPMD